MKSIHHTSKATYLKHSLNYKESHYFELPDGNVIVVGNIESAYAAALEAETETTALPFMLSNEKVKCHVAKSLAHLGVSESDNTVTACLKIKNHHPAFHPANL